jgi:hypothetical protein
MHVRVIHVVLLDLLQDFAINREGLVCFVIGCASKHVSQSRVTEDHHRNDNDADAGRSIHSSPVPENLQALIITLQLFATRQERNGKLAEVTLSVDFHKKTHRFRQKCCVFATGIFKSGLWLFLSH